jgi:hypothetical protein
VHLALHPSAVYNYLFVVCREREGFGMKKTINRKVYDTEKATHLGRKCVGEFGQPNGYEEQLFVVKKGQQNQHFIYGVGGPESKYSEPAIELITDTQASKWKKENISASK